MADSTDPARLADALLACDRAALARAITLVESRRADHRDRAQRLLAAVLPRAGRSTRVGISGVPGAGKSTLIDALGVMLTARGRRVAVLAVDPSSARTGGSILGDKTRMARLSVDPHAFVRPSPAAGTLGGVAARTRETIVLVEAAGFDTVLVETVGVGQSETAVAGMVDSFLVLMAPATGDDLQGIKKGILELADVVAVNKADGDTRQRALRAVADYRAALHILTPPDALWTPPVLAVSGLEGSGLDELWAAVEAHRARLEAAGALEDKRAGQRVAALRARFEERLVEHARSRPALAARLATLEAEVRAGRAPVEAAVEELLEQSTKDGNPAPWGMMHPAAGGDASRYSYLYEINPWTPRVDLEKIIFLRGAALTSWANIETQLIQIAFRCAHASSYRGLRGKFPFKVDDRLTYLERVLNTPGPLEQFMTLGLQFIDRYRLSLPIRNMMAHGRLRFLGWDWGAEFIWYNNAGGDHKIDSRRLKLDELTLLAKRASRLSRILQKAIEEIDRKGMLPLLESRRIDTGN